MLRICARMLALALALGAGQCSVQEVDDAASGFGQLRTLLPTPNVYRTASGAPSHEYWQQRADYRIEACLDEQARLLTGRETITYTNGSPDTLALVWLQLDQNRFKKDSLQHLSETAQRDDDGHPTYGCARPTGVLVVDSRLLMDVYPDCVHQVNVQPGAAATSLRSGTDSVPERIVLTPASG